MCGCDKGNAAPAGKLYHTGFLCISDLVGDYKLGAQRAEGDFYSLWLRITSYYINAGAVKVFGGEFASLINDNYTFAVGIGYLFCKCCERCGFTFARRGSGRRR